MESIERCLQAIRREQPDRVLVIPLIISHAASIPYAEDILKFPLRWEAEKFHEGLLGVFGADAFDVYEPVVAPEINLPVSTLVRLRYQG